MVYEKNSDRMELVAVSVYPKDTMELMAEYKETYGLSFPVGLANGELDCVDHSSIPVTIFIDKYGKVGKIQVGQMTQEGFEEYVDYFLSPDYDGTPIETPKQLDISLLIYLSLAWFPISFILRVIGRWGIFRKSGKKGWFSLIPFFSVYQEYSLAWMGWIGIIVSLFISSVLILKLLHFY